MADQPKSIEDLSPKERKELEEKLKNMSPEEIADLQKQQCIFCQIVQGKVPSKKVYEDDTCIAILDIQPATKGHLLLIPKEHYAIMPQVPDEVLQHLFKTSKRLSQALLRGLKVGGTSIFMANGQAAGQRALHFMIHLIPRKDGDKIIEDTETLIERSMQEKVRIAVQDKILSLMGVEKQTTLEDIKEEVGEDSDDGDEPEETQDTESSDSDSEEPETEEEPEESEEDDDTEEETKDEDVSLDDIANLFK
ncbi:HIT domain-containing protein [Candidatus Woesearchaeota archaeon]|jgi:histidine triad (HIT) family protein|nr:HIT domain-containing protein [Candidatus Woesearchaeota archaeon]MBT4247685.1 HIT domain-containing protein [Candidatus Woesearchaeota archaeon]MBT4434035.1 HIT domain-containing protein [Candidatus Woesearchaeota archaeon]MBT7332247.1 HIT domain-containing protein [Candidatus Woesearchaeota archaeon]